MYKRQVLNCGVNYQRESFSESSGLQVENYTAGDLKEVCQWLTLKVNETSSEVERDQDGVMVLDIPMEKYAAEAMRGLGLSLIHIFAEQKIHPHGHGWSIVNNVDQWSWETAE